MRRWTEIVSVLSKYGLADWLSQFHIDFLTNLLGASEGQSQSNLTQQQRIRMALAELGPTFIKFGQLLSTRPDAIGQELAEELSKLQSDTPSDDFETVKSIVESELGKPLECLAILKQRRSRRHPSAKSTSPKSRPTSSAASPVIRRMLKAE